MPQWTFLTHHAHLIIQVAQNPDATLEELAASVGISTRSAVTILNDLEAAGYLERERRGRRNHYVLHGERPLRHPSNAAHTVDELITALRDIG
ncbi:helix-turn-helix transcriptional regulator [Salinibacterium soli]|uniref:MarR family transcriptional regulator n=1 Tax=Antiquaquibacter soli TaxID=3064523 RepID=A0ABT9BS63_9MICO|nr:MarR family transcriptional regulator [Protaetiibacter sp. WY-16]MDO7882626.1 MarR family transcriptional regulator [Protaetiibacter sp. WY-16]